MRVCIHRGSHQIGGTCIEIESQQKRIVVDLGIPLDAEVVDQSLVPPVSGLVNHDPTMLGVIISHLHGDHVGLSKYLNNNVPYYIGRQADRILQAAANYIPENKRIIPTGYLENKKSFQIGPFTIIPFLVDHSAFDAYALLIEADGKRLFYSGDFRAHGRKCELFEKFINRPPNDIDALLLEGSCIERLKEDEFFQTESELEDDFLLEFQEKNRPMLVWQSSQNIDRLVTVYRAAIRSGRRLVIDLYSAEVLAAIETISIPKVEWPQIDLFVPQRQRIQIKKRGDFQYLNESQHKRIYPDDLQAALAQSVMLFRPMMINDLNHFSKIKNSKCIYSMWTGNLKKEQQTLEWFNENNIELVYLHTSGHASIPDLQKFAKSLAPKALIPIHTFHPARYVELFPNVVLRQDGEWWSV